MRKPKNSPKYPNLVAEMSRTGVEIQDLCQATGKAKAAFTTTCEESETATLQSPTPSRSRKHTSQA